MRRTPHPFALLLLDQRGEGHIEPERAPRHTPSRNRDKVPQGNRKNDRRARLIKTTMQHTPSAYCQLLAMSWWQEA
jgi:hypothetical protein